MMITYKLKLSFYDLRYNPQIVFLTKTKNQMEKAFLKILLDVEPDLVDQIQEIKRMRQANTLLEIFKYMIDDCGMNSKSIEKIIELLVDSALKKRDFLFFLKKDFIYGWVTLKIFYFAKNKTKNSLKNMIDCAIEYSSLEELQKDNILQLISQMSKKGVEFVPVNMVDEIIQDNFWKYFQHSWNYEKLYEMKEKLEQLKNIPLEYYLQKGLIMGEEMRIGLYEGEESEIENQIHQFFKVLDDFLSQKGITSRQIKKILKNIHEISPQNFGKNILHLQSQIHPINISLLSKLNLESKENLQSIKDLILLLGPTGSGKTTIAQVCLGYNLQKGKFQGLNTLKVCGKMKTQHLAFKASPETISCTTYVKAAKIPEHLFCQEIQPSEIFITDTPGFSDTRGSEIDISNSLSILQTIQNSDSIVPVLVINQKLLGNKCQGLKEFLRIISNFFFKYDQTLRRKVIFVLNNFSFESLKQLPNYLTNIQKHLNETNENMKEIIKHLKRLMKNWESEDIEKYTKQKLNQIIIFDPLKPDMKEILKKFMNQERKLTDSKQYIDYHYSEKVKKDIEREFNFLQSFVRNNLEKQNYEEIVYYLNQLKTFQRILQSTEKYERLFDQMKKKLQKLFQQFQKHIDCQVLDLTINSSIANEIKQKRKQVEFMEKAFQKIIVQQESFESKIKKKIQNTAEKLLETVQKNKSNKKSIQTIKVFAENFNEQLQNKLLSTLNKFLEERNQEIMKAIEDNCFSLLNDNLKEENIFFEDVKNLYDIEFKRTDWTEEINKKMKKFKNQVQNNLENCEKQKKLNLTPEKINLIKDILKTYNFAENHKNTYSKLYELGKRQIISMLLAKFDEQLNKLRQFFKQGQNHFQANRIKNHHENVKQFLQIPEIKERKSNEYKYFQKTILDTFQDRKQFLQKKLKNKKILENESLEKILTFISEHQKILFIYEDSGQKAEFSELIQNTIKNIKGYFQYKTIETIQKFRIKNFQESIKQKINHLLSLYSDIKEFDKKKNEKISEIEKFVYSKIVELINKFLQQLKKIQTNNQLSFNEVYKLSTNFKIIESVLSFFKVLSEIRQKKLKEKEKQFKTNLQKIFQEQLDNIRQWEKISENFYESENQITENCIGNLKIFLFLNKNLLKYKEIVSFLKEEQLQGSFAEKNEMVIESFQKLKETVREKFEKISKQDVSKANQFLNQKIKLKKIDSYLEEKNQFQSLIKQLRSELSKKQQKFASHPEVYITEDQIQFYVLEEKFSGTQKQKNLENVDEIKKIKILLQNVVQKKELEIKRKNNLNLKQFSKQYEEFLKYSEIRNKILQLPEKLHPHFNKNIPDNFCDYFLENLVQHYEELKEKSEKGEEKINQDLVFLKKLQDQISTEKEELFFSKYQKLKNQKLGSQNMRFFNAIKDIQEEKKRYRENKFLNSQTIEISSELMDCWKFFSQNEKSKLLFKITDQRNEKFTELQNKFLTQKDSDFDEEINKIKKENRYLPTQIQSQLNQVQRCEKLKQKRKNEIVLICQKISTNFHPLSDLKEFLTQQNQVKIKTFKKLYEKHFRNVNQEIENQEGVDLIVNKVQRFISLNQKNTSSNCKHFNQLYDLHQKNMFKSIVRKIQRFQDRLKNKIDLKQLISLSQLLNFFVKNQSKFRNFPAQLNKDEFQKILNSQSQKTKNIFQNELKIQKLLKSEVDEVEKNIELLEKYISIFKELKEQKNVIYPLESLDSFKAIVKSQIQQRFKLLIQMQFYGGSTKNFQFARFEEHFSNIECKLKELNKLLLINNKKLFIQVQAEVSVRKVERSINQKFNDEIDESLKNVDDGFKQTFTDFEERVNVIYKIGNVLEKNKYQISLQASRYKQIEKAIEKKYAEKEESISCLGKKIIQFQAQYYQNLKKIQAKQNGEINKARRESEKMIEKSRSQINIKKEKQPFEVNEGKDIIEKKYQSIIIDERNKINSETNLKKQKISSQAQKQKEVNEKKISELINEFISESLIMEKAIHELVHKKQFYKQKHKKNCDQIFSKLNRNMIRKIYSSPLMIQENESLPKLFLMNHEKFKYHIIELWNKKVEPQNIKYVIDRLKISEREKEEILKRYQTYCEEYQNILNEYTNNQKKNTLNNFIKKAKSIGQNLSNYYHSSSPIKNKDSPEILISLIYAIWTISKAETDIEQQKIKYDYKPHPAQITAILLLLNLTHQKIIKLQNCMSEVGTGEGKSLILGGLSCYLALCGYEVSCACYSNYLSKRDEQSFINLFKMFDIQKKIKYGIFNEICESLLNNQELKMDFSTYIKDIILKEESYAEKLSSFFNNLFSIQFSNFVSKKSRRVLLIDEVDVFFDQNFYGSLYCPSITLQSKQITALIKKVWKSINLGNRNYDDLNSCREAIIVKKKYPHLKLLIDEQINGMIYGAKNYKHPYIVHNNTICYKENDEISYTKNQGYRTIFAFLHEYEKHKITESVMEKAMLIDLVIAEFSYAVLPTYFCKIMGVTGTLTNMSKYKIHELKEFYQVKKQIAIPSVYGNVHERRKIRKRVVKNENHHKLIIQQIKSVHKSTRPILVFFRDIDELYNFFTLKQYVQLQNQTTFLTEMHEPSERDKKINKSSYKNQITLLTNSFGRGTDFIVFDEQILKKGGLHVIQTFLSKDLSEQIQIQGRTARQGQVGSYSLIVSEQEMKILSISNILDDSEEKELNDALVERARDQIENSQGLQIKKLVRQANEKHQNFVDEFLKEKLTQQTVIQNIVKLNSYNLVRKKNVRTILGIDGTCSMSKVFLTVLNILDGFFDDLNSTFSKELDEVGFQMKIVCYRNYNCSPFKLLQKSQFEYETKNLKKFIKQLSVNGGWGHQAIEVLFSEVNKQKVDQVILIGDAACNTKEQTLQKRKQSGEQFWNKNGFPLCFGEDQLKQIIRKKIPINSFYLGDRYYFQSVSSFTQGKCKSFDINSSTASKDLADFMAHRIISLSTNDRNLKINLIKEYDEKSRKRFTKN